MKIRIQDEDSEVVEIVSEIIEMLFADQYRFSAPRLGKNPKYAKEQKYMAYGESRIKNGKPIMDKTSLEKIRQKLKAAKEFSLESKKQLLES